MALTLTYLKTVAQHAVGTPGATLAASSDLTLQEIVNQAGRFMCSMHEWSFLNRPYAVLASEAAQEYLTLPTDFGTLIDVLPTQGRVMRFEKTTPEDIELIRSRNLAMSSLIFWVCVEYPTQASATVNAGNPRLKIYPAPSANVDDFARCLYRAKWMELASGSSVANIPLEYESLLVKAVKEFARAYEDDDYDAEARLMQSPLFERLIRHDANQQWNLGYSYGGITQSDQRGPTQPFTTISDPSPI